MGEETISPRAASELATCFDAHARDLFGYACVLARGDRAAADDLVQATFQAAGRAWRALRDLAEEQRRSWLRATLANLAIDRFRGEATSRDWLPTIETGCGNAEADPAEQDFPPVTLERCWQIIEGLPEPQHVVALLRWRAGMKEAEIAAALGLAEATVSGHLHRVRRKLIAQLGPDYPHTSDDPDGASS